MTDFETNPTGTMQELHRLKDERDALAAHVERLYEALKHLRHNAHASGAEMGLALDVANDALEAVPATSLTRLKAKWQAEVLYEFTHGSYVMPATLNLAMCKRAKELRRQAEE